MRRHNWAWESSPRGAIAGRSGTSPQFRKIRTLLYRKYPQYPDEAALEESDDTIVEMIPTRLSLWGLDES